MINYNETKEACPICRQRGMFLRHLPAIYIIRELKRFFSVAEIPPLDICDYSLFVCSACSLEFAVPPVPGSKAFYDWITAKTGYYSASRWEYQTVVDKISTFDAGLLLDVGCGDGEFLSFVGGLLDIKAIGIDLTQSSVDKCKKKGIEAHCMDIATYMNTAATSRLPDRFDFIVAFHSLEHMAYPLRFIESLKQLLTRNGLLFLSTPYSPVSYEYSFYAPLNNPPHHLTRWNRSSYIKLAETVNMKIDFLMPVAESPFKRAFQSMRIGVRGYNSTIKELPFLIVAHPLVTFKEMYLQLSRERFNGKVLPDIIMAQLSF